MIAPSAPHAAPRAAIRDETRHVNRASIRRNRRIAALAAALATGLGWWVAQAMDAPPTFETTLLSDHPLTGRIWQSGSSPGRFVDLDVVQESIDHADIVLLGEKHDNPDHHRLQAHMTEMAAASGPIVVLFEMVPTDRGAALADHLSAPAVDIQALGPAVGWSEMGWPTWEWYSPIAAIAAAQRDLAPRSSIRAANAPRAIASSRPQRSLTDTERRDLALDIPLEPDLARSLNDEIIASHCGMIPEAVAPAVAEIQRIRDAWMAREAIRARREHPEARIVVIAGGGHTRKDRGIPWYLRRMAPDLRSVTIRPAEVARGETVAADYLFADESDDFLWFTPRVDERDPCDAFRQPDPRSTAPKQ